MFFSFQIIINHDTKILTVIYILNNFAINMQKSAASFLQLEPNTL